MITDKRLMRLLALLLCVLMLFGFASCDRTRDNTDALESLLGTDEEDDDGGYAATEYYRIVLTGRCTPRIFSMAGELESAIEEATGIECGIVYDTDKSAYRDDVIEILIGATNRNATAVALEGRRADDYVCAVVDGAIVVGGYSSSATETALERFAEEIIPYATRESLMSAGDGFSYTHEYEIDEMLLCGFDMTAYTLVYPKNATCGEDALAERIAALVAAESGGVMSLAEGDEESGRKEIVIVADPKVDAATARIFAQEEDVVISADSAEGLVAACDRLSELLLENVSDGRATLELTEEISFTYRDEPIPATDNYLLIVPSACSEELYLAARELAAMIEERTATPCYLTYDSIPVLLEGSVIEIVLGNAEHTASAIALLGMRAADHSCRYVGDAVFIGGITDTATVAAIDRFVRDILKDSTVESLMSADAGFEHRGEYSLDSIRLCGFEISDYAIVCPEELSEYGNVLAGGILDRGGYLVPVVSDGEGRGRSIVISINDLSAGNANIYLDGRDVIISAADAYGISVAVDRFYSMLLGGEGDSVSLELTEEISLPYTAAELRVMSVISEIGMAESDLVAIIGLASLIKTEAPDAVVLGSVTKGVYTMLMYELSADYECALTVGKSGRYMPVLYRRQTTSLTEVSSHVSGGADVFGLTLVHIPSNESYTLAVIGSDEVMTDAAFDAAVASSAFGKSDSALVFVARDGESDLPDVSGEKLSTALNSEVAVGEVEYRLIFATADNLECTEEADIEKNSGNNAAVARVTLGKSRFGGFLKDAR